MNKKVFTAVSVWVAVGTSLLPGVGSPVQAAEKAPTGIAVHSAAPDFTLTDSEGKSRTLKEFRGRPTAVFFYCGCSWCTDCARLWGQFQRGGTLTTGALQGKNAATLIVFTGDGDSAKQFAQESGMDLASTILLPDTQMQVTSDLYHVDPCPRVYVVDPKGNVSYTNDHKDDTARKAPAIVIVSRALDAMRAAVTTTQTPAKSLHHSKLKHKANGGFRRK